MLAIGALTPRLFPGSVSSNFEVDMSMDSFCPEGDGEGRQTHPSRPTQLWPWLAAGIGGGTLGVLATVLLWGTETTASSSPRVAQVSRRTVPLPPPSGAIARSTEKAVSGDRVPPPEPESLPPSPSEPDSRPPSPPVPPPSSNPEPPYLPPRRPKTPSVAIGLEIGNQAPEIDGPDLDGQSFRLSDYRGKVVVLDFWGNW